MPGASRGWSRTVRNVFYSGLALTGPPIGISHGVATVEFENVVPASLQRAGSAGIPRAALAVGKNGPIDG